MPDTSRLVIRLTLYTRPGCHLCEDMKAVIDRAIRGVPTTCEEVDISKDPTLEQRYGMQIPVLLVNGRKIAKYRIGEEDLRRALRGSAG